MLEPRLHTSTDPKPCSALVVVHFFKLATPLFKLWFRQPEDLGYAVSFMMIGMQYISLPQNLSSDGEF